MSFITEAIDRAEQIQARLLAHQPDRIRDWSRRFNLPERAGLLSGPRGVGKTTWMLSQVEPHHMLYLSADNPVLSTVPLFDLLEGIFMRGYEGVLVDEVHYAADWARHLKAAYDAFPKHRITASDSSTVVLRKEMADLSRRFPVHTMPLLSFREFLALKLNRDIPQIDPFNPLKSDVQTLVKEINVLRLFREYLDGGFRPFFLEEKTFYQEKVMNTIAKTMESDIPFLVPQITENHLRLMHSVVGYLAVSTVPTLQVNSLCREWSLGKEKLYQLLSAMERAHLLRIIRKRNDTKINSVGAKLLLHEPSVYGFFGKNEGTQREAFTVAAFADAGYEVFASSNETDCDFIINGLRIEVGGQGKKAKSADLIIRDNTDLPFGNILPMWLIGLVY
jgi:hypothetical protein